MSFFSKTDESIKKWVITLFVTALFLVFCVFISYAVFKNATFLVLAIILLFIVVTALSFIVLLSFKQKLDVKPDTTYLYEEIDYLKQSLQRAEETSKNKTVYLSNMSHEIRIPLSTVLGMLNMLKETDLDGDQRAQVEIADYSSEHLLQLVNMVLDNSKGVDEKIRLENETMNIEADLSKLFKIFEYQAWDKGLEFESKFLIDRKHNFLLLGDIKRIQQVLINLINNAIKFTLNGKITITVDHTVTHDDNQVVTFYIKDTGAGMSPYEVKHAFVPPEERQSESMRHYRGSGVGLSITNSLVNLMGGKLKVESKENEGSTFYFSLQLQKTLNIKKEVDTPESVLLNQFDFKFSVLVAEDNKMNQKVIKFLLEQEGVDCTFVTNGIDAVNLYTVLNFDMIFMDIYMPDMDGYEATRAIKATSKYAKHNIPIIAVSASAFEKDIERAKASGVDYFLAKPIEKDKLKDLLSKYSPTEHTS
ncbi:MAG: ATP-binding protein [Algibacter sp.]